MTEPTPDTPESERTGDGLRAAATDVVLQRAERRAGGGLVLTSRVAMDRLAAILAALPNREAAPREEWPSRDEFNRMSAAEVNAFLASIGATQRVREADPREGLDFAAFAATNRARCESADGFGHPLNGWSLSDWMLAATGEFGEAANVAKKLNRERDGIPGNTQTPDELRAALMDEFADAVIYLDLAAQSQGFALGDAIVSKFDRTSEKIGAPHRLGR